MLSPAAIGKATRENPFPSDHKLEGEKATWTLRAVEILQGNRNRAVLGIVQY